VNLLYVPYRRAAGVLPDLFSSQVRAYFGFNGVNGRAHQGREAAANSSDRCGPRCSIAECSGHCRDFAALRHWLERNWCPAGTPVEIVQKFNEEINFGPC
jgi:hypothetical protein